MDEYCCLPLNNGRGDGDDDIRVKWVESGRYNGRLRTGMCGASNGDFVLLERFSGET